MRRHTQHNRKAFTLVELLLVIAIILILVALLMPALERVQRRVDTVVCMSNLRQLMIAMNMYQGENRGEWPSSLTYTGCGYGLVDSPGATTPDVYWDDPDRVRRGVLFPYVNSLKVYVCPTFRKTYQMNASFATRTPACTYTMNTWLDSCPSAGWANGRACLHRSQLWDYSMARLAVLGDEGVLWLTDPKTGAALNSQLQNNLSLGVGGYGPDGICDVVASFHNSADPYKGVGNVAFGDGHIEQVEPYRSKDVFTPKCYKQPPYTYPCQ